MFVWPPSVCPSDRWLLIKAEGFPILGGREERNSYMRKRVWYFLGGIFFLETPSAQFFPFSQFRSSLFIILSRPAGDCALDIKLYCWVIPFLGAQCSALTRARGWLGERGENVGGRESREGLKNELLGRNGERSITGEGGKVEEY